MSFTFTKSSTEPKEYLLGNVSECIIAICVMLYIYHTFYSESFEGLENPYATRLPQCATDGLPGTQAGANCWGQIGPQGCPVDLPPCEDPNEDFLGGGHNEQPVFYAMGNERAVAKATRASSGNNNVNSKVKNSNAEEFDAGEDINIFSSNLSVEDVKSNFTVEDYINY